jgi:hypothetical protein
MHTEGMPLRKVRDFGEKIGDTFVFLRGNFRQLAIAFLVFALPLLAVGVFIQSTALTGLYSALLRGVMDRPEDLLTVDFLWYFLVILFTSASYATAMYAYMRLYEEKDRRAPAMQELGQLYIRKVFPVFFHFLLLGLLFTLAAVVIAVLLGFITPVLSVLAIIVLFVYAGVVFSNLLVTVVAEDRSFGVAFSRCFYIIRGQFWSTLGLLFVLYLIFAILSSIVNVLFGAFFGLGSFVSSGGDMEKMKTYLLISALLQAAAQIFYMIFNIGVGLNYYSLLEEKEGVDLETRIDAIGTFTRQSHHTDEEY